MERGALNEFAKTMRMLQEGSRDAWSASQGTNDPRYQRYLAEAQAGQHDLTHLGLPIPLLVFGFAAGGQSLAISFVEHVAATRRDLSARRRVYFPILGITDGYGSVSPQGHMPYSFAMATGLSAAGLSIAAEKAAEGRSMVGCGCKDSAQMVELGGQRGCVILDLSEQKLAQPKLLPGLLKAAEAGYYAVVVGKRSEKYLEAVRRAFPPDHLLVLPASELGGGSAGEKVQAVEERLVTWYLEREEVKEEVARRAAAAQRAQQPMRRREAQERAEAAAHAAGCPCCGGSEQAMAEHTGGLMVSAMTDPAAAVERLRQGDGQMAFAIANVLAAAIESNAVGTATNFYQLGLFQVLFQQLRKGRAPPPNYLLWAGCLAVAVNATRFGGEQGDLFRTLLLDAGLAQELAAARASRDANVRDAASNAIKGLREHGCWEARCDWCGREEGAAEGGLKRCSGCKQRRFCSKECQVRSWKEGGHKAECAQLAAAR